MVIKNHQNKINLHKNDVNYYDYYYSRKKPYLIVFNKQVTTELKYFTSIDILFILRYILLLTVFVNIIGSDIRLT